MKVNGKTEVADTREGLSRDTGEIPEVISVRTAELMPLLVKWRRSNPRVPWKHLLADSVKLKLAPLAGKRYAHLVSAKGEVAA